jgi:peptidoglycan-N-acetylglucosamine deacetylase
MRVGGYLLAISVSLAAISVAQAQRILGPMPSPGPAASSAPATEAHATQGAAPAAATAPSSTCHNPNALGVSRVVQIDTTGGPAFGFEQFKAYDFLQPKEVVLTFDDGPWPGNTPRVLAALKEQCVKAMFFPIGEHAMWHPELLKEVYAAGHTIGTHTWSHKDLAKLPFDQAKGEIEEGFSAIALAIGHPPAPFFRFPSLTDPPEVLKYLGTRNIGIFSTDIDTFDFKIRKPEQVVQSVMSKLKKHGKGILLMHDFQKATSYALPKILAELKAGGYKVVQVTAKDTVHTLPEYDAMARKAFGPDNVAARPVSSVVKTISQ